MISWQIDPAHSTVEFSVRHMMFATVKGRFQSFTAALTTDDANPKAAKVEVAIDAASVNTHQDQRDAHLRSADFFEVEQHPKLTYVSRRIEGDPASDFTIVGDLTIRGVTREVPLKATFTGEGKDPWGGTRRGFTAAGTINRSEFGLTWNQALEAGGILVSEEVKIAIDAQFTKST